MDSKYNTRRTTLSGMDRSFQNRWKNLCKIKGLSEAKLDKIIECAMKLENMGFINGLDLLEKRKEILQITTGSTKLDELLQGGLESQSLTEIYGE